MEKFTIKQPMLFNFAKDYTISVVGAGYVGLPLALSAAEAGMSVNCIDKNRNKLLLLESGKSPINTVTNKRISDCLLNNDIGFSRDYEKVNNSNVVLICVPTPLIDKTKIPDLTYVKQAVVEISKNIKKKTLVILESTVYPGATREIVVGEIQTEHPDWICGIDYFVVHSAEREDPGNKQFNIKNTPKVIGGFTDACTKSALAFYRTFIEYVYEVDSLEIAECSKLFENIFRSVNIALVNELKIICDSLGVDVYKVIDAASTKPYGFMKFVPGPGVGGHCIKPDPYYLSWSAQKAGLQTKFINLAGEINDTMPKYTCKKIQNELNEKGFPLKEARILALGLSYKKNVNDIRESPAIEVIKGLLKHKAVVHAYDPLVGYAGVVELSINENFKMLVGGVAGLPIERRFTIDDNYDAIVILTDHDEIVSLVEHQIDRKLEVEDDFLIMDTRNCLNEKYYINEKSRRSIKI